MPKDYLGKTLLEWRLVPEDQRPAKVQIAIINSDRMLAGNNLAEPQADGRKIYPVDGPRLTGRDEPFGSPEREELDVLHPNKLTSGSPLSDPRPLPGLQEELKAAIREEGEQFFRHLGAVDSEGRFILTEPVLSLFTLEAMWTLRYHNIRGNLKAAVEIIQKLLPEPRQEFGVEVAQMKREELQVLEEKILQGMSPAARKELESQWKMLPPGEPK